jgi:hypothetical protein
MNFSNIKNLTIPEGNVTALSIGGVELWSSVPSEVTLTITGSARDGSAKVTINGVVYNSANTLVVPYGTAVTCYVIDTKGPQDGSIWVNGEKVASGDPVTYDYIAKKNAEIKLSDYYYDYIMSASFRGCIEITET